MSVVINEPVTVASDHIDLLKQLHEIIAQHPAGAQAGFQLLYVPQTLEVAPDEILVQQVAAQVLTIVPRKLSELKRDDVIHASQVADPKDTEFTNYAQNRKDHDCTKSSSGAHLYKYWEE